MFSHVCVYVCVCVGSEVGGRTQYRLLCKDAGGETEQTMLHETVPTWVVDVTVQVFVTASLCPPRHHLFATFTIVSLYGCTNR